MIEVGVFEAKNKLSELLDQVARGAEITITKRGRAIARLVPPDVPFDRNRARRAADDLIARSRGTTLGDVSLKDLIDEGRP